jgi:tetratricopeptide (TPR) repeat protein
VTQLFEDLHNGKEFVKSKTLKFILICSIIETFFSLQVAMADIGERQRLHILKESGQRNEAYEGYKAAIAKHPKSIPLVLDFVELLIGMERFDESRNLLKKIRPEDIDALNDNDKRRISLLNAQILVKREEFDTAISEIEPFADSKDDQLLIADIYLMEGQWRKSLRILGGVEESVYYTPYERDLARKKIANIRRHYAPRINADAGIVDSKEHGSIPWSSVSGEIRIYKNNRLTTSYLWMDGGDFFSVGMSGFPGKVPVELLLSITGDGDAGASFKTTFKPIKKSYVEIKGYYNEVERELTALMDEFSLKKGSFFRFDYEFSDMLTGTFQYEYSDYPQGCMNIVNIGATHNQHLSVKKIVLYHTVNMLVIEGHEDYDDDDDTVYIAKHLYMPSYIFGLLYPVSDEYYSGHVAFKIGMGYLFGIDNEGLALSPGCSFDLRIHGDVGLKGGAEYRLDEVSGKGEWRTNVGIELLF